MKIRWSEFVLHLRPVAAALTLILTVSGSARAQLTPVGNTVPTLAPGSAIQEMDVTYDPAHDAYLVVTAYGPVWGVFVDAANNPLTPVFTIADGSLGFGHRPIAIYSPDISNGVDGSGGFLVTWNAASGGGSCNNASTPCTLQDRVVSLRTPGYLVNGVQTITDTSQGSIWFENHATLAYSRTDHQFLVAWMTIIPAYGIQARFVSTTGAPVGGTIRLEETGSRDPGLVWNSATDQFGMVNAGFSGGSAYAQFRLISAGGAVSGVSTFGYAPGTYATAIDLNSSNQYVLTWALSPGVVSASFDQNGTGLGTAFVSNRIGGDTSLDMTFNPTTNTFAAVSSDYLSSQVAASELYSNGAPLTAAGIITNSSPVHGSFYPRVTTRSGTNQWNVGNDTDFVAVENQIVASSGFFGTPPSLSPLGSSVSASTSTSTSTSSGGCSTPDPFTAIGGGTCINGGWVPGGSGASSSSGGSTSSSTTTSSGGCSTPDPFTSIGGGTCVNGGWVPGGSGASSSSGGSSGGSTSSSTTSSSAGCSTPDPFTSIGGGTCINGGWVPGGSGASSSSGGSSGGSTSTGGSSSSSSASTCSGSDPFASIGGGHCVNGGWVPGAASSTSSGTCSGSDPFASIGGGTCVNGGWVPASLAGGCSTPDPFTSIGGGVCINGGWVPKG